MYAVILTMVLMVNGSIVFASEESLEAMPGVPVDVSPSVIAEVKGGVRLEVTKVDDGVRPHFLHEVYSTSEEVFGVAAEVRFEFYNGRLMQIDIYPGPDDAADALRYRIAEWHGVSGSAPLRAGVDLGCFRLEESEDAFGRTYISITVTEVLARFRAWIEQYS